MSLDIWQLSLLGLMGFVSGWINVMAGGGSILTVPVMVFMGVPAPVANGTNRLGVLAQSLTAVLTFRRLGYSELKLGLSLSLVAAVGAAAGAQVGVELEGVWFNRVLAVVMVLVMVAMATGGEQHLEGDAGTSPPKRLLLGHLCMLGAGFWGGFIQIGVGFILMPILHRVMGLDLVRVNMHKVLIVLVFTIVALIVFAAQVEILWVAGAWLAVGSAIGGWLGAHSTIRHGEVWVRRVLYATITVFVIKLLW